MSWNNWRIKNCSVIPNLFQPVLMCDTVVTHVTHCRVYGLIQLTNNDLHHYSTHLPKSSSASTRQFYTFPQNEESISTADDRFFNSHFSFVGRNLGKLLIR